MIRYHKDILDNGLRVLVHEDFSTPMVAVNVLYDVGSKDEDPNHTGFAHLFEHLMFGGSENVPDFDWPIQLAGGENNAFTNADMTNFYDIVPAENIETALWLESDRMKHLKFSQKALDIQKKVVVEEFKETCLNQPYGDMWHHLCDLAYQNHPYRWPTIGLEIAHIEEANLIQVEAFFKKYYGPQNAILTIAGNVKVEDAIAMADKWFGDIDSGEVYKRNIPEEPEQKEYRKKTVTANVPMRSITLAFHMPDRIHADYYAYDLLSDVLGGGPSARFYRRLVKEQGIFSDLDAFITGSNDKGLFVITGKPMGHISTDTAISALWKELDELVSTEIDTPELEKLINKVESNLIFSEISVLHRAMSLAYYESLGDADIINQEPSYYRQVTSADILRVAKTMLQRNKCNELVYLPSGS